MRKTGGSGALQLGLGRRIAFPKYFMASKRALRRRTCGEKRRYPTREAAVTALIRLIRARPCMAMLRSYHCRFCRAYHFGHTGAPSNLRVSHAFAGSR
jgi:hypothetical protein